MTFEEAKALARNGVKVTHEYFTKDEYMTMQGNLIVFEDGAKIFADEWSKGKDYLLVGWSVYKEPHSKLKDGECCLCGDKAESETSWICSDCKNL